MLKTTREILENAIFHQKAFPGASVAVFDNGKVLTLCSGTFGGNEHDKPIDENTLFDLASITKAVATTLAVAFLLQEGRLGLEDTLGSLIPTANSSDYATCTIEQLLSHTSGLPSWLPLYKNVPVHLVGKPKAKPQMLEALLLSTPIGFPGEKETYSDLDFFLLGLIVEKCTGNKLQLVVEDNVFTPLGLTETVYCPLEKSYPKENIAPTGFCSLRNRILQGEVNDENTWACGQVAGQAGLFGTTKDLMKIALEIIDGLNGEGMIFDQELLQILCNRPNEKKIEGSFALGWDKVSSSGTLTGSYFGPSTVGHHGFTGTSFWIEPEKKVAIALATNHVHYDKRKEKINRIRPAFFDAVWEDISKV